MNASCVKNLRTLPCMFHQIFFRNINHRNVSLKTGHCMTKSFSYAKYTIMAEPNTQLSCSIPQSRKFHKSGFQYDSSANPPSVNPLPEIPSDLNVLKDMQVFCLKQIAFRKLGMLGHNIEVKYEIQVNKEKPLLIVDHFYGSNKPYFLVRIFKIGTEITVESEPLVFMNTGKTQNHTNAYFLTVPPQRIIASTEYLRGCKPTLVVRDEKYDVTALLIGDGDVASSRTAMILSGNGKKRIGKIVRNADVFHRDSMDISIHCPGEWEPAIKLAVACSCIIFVREFEKNI